MVGSTATCGRTACCYTQDFIGRSRGAAIPAYFPEHSTGDKGMIDDGVVANAPDLIFISKAMTMRQPDATAQAYDQGHPLLPSRI